MSPHRIVGISPCLSFHARWMSGANLVGGQFVIAGGDAPTLLDLVEEPLDQIASRSSTSRELCRARWIRRIYPALPPPQRTVVPIKKPARLFGAERLDAAPKSILDRLQQSPGERGRLLRIY